MPNEIVRQTVLVLQLFFAQHPTEARVHISQPTADACYDAARNFQKKVREWEGRKVTAIGAGCYVEYEVVGEDM